MRFVATLLALAACTSAQSARPVAPGHAEVSVGLGRGSLLEKDVSEGDWAGHLMVRFGVTEGFDFGLHALHTPGAGGAGGFAMDPKVRLARNGRLTVAVGSPTGIVFEEVPELGYAGFFTLPGLYLSLEVSPTVELIANGRFDVSVAEGREAASGMSVTLAPRFTDETRTWAVLPEVGFARVEDTAYLTIGLSIAVGTGSP